MTQTAPRYFILEDGHPMNGEFYSREEVVKQVQYAEPDAQVWAVSFGNSIGKAMNVTNGVLYDAYSTYAWDYDEYSDMPEIFQAFGDVREWHEAREAARVEAFA